MNSFVHKTPRFANSGLYATFDLLRVTKPAGGAGDTFQGLVEDVIIRALSHFPVSLPSLPKQLRALPDFPVQLLLM